MRKPVLLLAALVAAFLMPTGCAAENTASASPSASAPASGSGSSGSSSSDSGFQSLGNGAALGSGGAIGPVLVPVTPSVSTPVASPAGGTYGSTQSVELTTSTPGASVYYTTDGSTPTCSSTAYSGPISVASSMTIGAIGCAPGYTPSGILTAAYTITNLPITYSPAAGTYGSAQTVTVTTNVSGAKIFCTTDGTPPSPADAMYTGPISVNSTTTLNCVASVVGVIASNIQDSTSNFATPQSGPSCCGGSGTGTATMQTVSSPSLSGKSMEFSGTSTESETSYLWHAPHASCDNCEYVNFNFNLYPPSSFSNLNAIEDEPYIFDGTRQLNKMIGLQWDQNNGVWDVWKGSYGTGSGWVGTSCTKAPTPGAWNTMKLAAHVEVGTTSCTMNGTAVPCKYYDSFTVNGQACFSNITEPTGPLESGFAADTGCQFQLDAENPGTVTEYADNVTCAYTYSISAAVPALYTIE